jgi:AraC family transcriptional regulator, regulatory protein of adaptative response / methylated-DNA-[protein]-cysteine methyltransferase
MTRSAGSPTDKEMRDAWRRRDARYDGVFYFGVSTTGIYCRPSCPSRPRLENLQFFTTEQDAVRSGFRPCKRCHPELANGRPPDWIAGLMTRVTASPEMRISAQELRAQGIAPERARRWFQKHHGMTFAAWCRGVRLSHAFTQMRNGTSLDDVALSHGYESHSGFRSAFTRIFSQSPGNRAGHDPIYVALLDTPLGAMLAAADVRDVVHLEFADRPGLERSYESLRRHFGRPVVPGETPLIQQLRSELGDYFANTRREFTVPFRMQGTPFQERVWRGLQQIPHGATESYETVARRIGSPTAVRAVARANATNRLYLLIPCHRVIGKDGRLSGYGGGVARKQRLLELEQSVLGDRK